MEEHSDFMHSEELQDWIKQRLDTAVKELADQGMVESAVIEAKPAWVMPFTLLIGKVREHGRASGFDWFICGDAPITVANSNVAATPREAARHFSLQWQLEAARQGTPGEGLAQRAEALFELVEEESLWRQGDRGQSKGSE